MFDSRSLSPDNSPEENAPSLPAAPSPFELLQQKPELARAIPRFISLDEVTHDQLLSLFEKLEFPIDSEGLPLIEKALRDGMKSFNPGSLFEAQIDGLPINLTFNHRTCVGNGNIRQVSTVTLTREDYNSDFAHFTVILNTHRTEKGRFHLILEVNEDHVRALQMEQSSWNDLNVLLATLGESQIPAELDSESALCDFDTEQRPCVIVEMTPRFLLGMAPLEECSIEQAPEETVTPLPTLVRERSPQQLVVFDVTVDDLRFITQELAHEGEKPCLSLFDREQGEKSFLNAAWNCINAETLGDMDIWELNSLESPLEVAVNQQITFGNREYWTRRDSDDDSSEYGDETADWQEDSTEWQEESEAPDSWSQEPESDRDEIWDPEGRDPGEDQDEDSGTDEELTGSDIVSNISCPDISLAPHGPEGREISIVISKEDLPAEETEDDDTGQIGAKQNTGVVTATIYLHSGLSRQQRWALADRISAHFEECSVTTEPSVIELLELSHYVKLEKVAFFVPFPGGRNTDIHPSHNTTGL